MFELRARQRPLAAVLAALGLSAAVSADLPRMTRLADGVYMYEHVDPTKAGVTANNLVVIGADAVLVADGQGTVENTGDLVTAIAAITKTPIKYVIVGSEHGDHRGGDSAFPDTAVFIAHPSSKAALEKQAAAPARRPNAPSVVVPAETVSDSRTIDLGGRQAIVRFLGRAHTGGDLEVLLPKERIAFMSEAFISGIFPSMANGFPTEWVEVLRRAEALDADVFVPAHGVMASRAETSRAALAEYRQVIEQVIAEGRRLHDAGVAVADAPARAQFGSRTALHRYAENVAGALGRVYLEIDGQLPGQD
ncbi:MAG TPA: MBL fold metallo-hydrolase [Vicinamibacterales bacterium]|nr:MBL fold metallo-hydrolase [Vicinamibacterales bacterium]